ncbi:hypothetical protein Prudu_001524, partial [Prunus dulcis]
MPKFALQGQAVQQSCQGDHAWHDDVLEVSDGGKATSLTAHLFPSPIAMQAIGAKVHRALNIPLRFRVALAVEKAAAKSSRGEATSSHAKDGSPSRKKPRLPSAEKTQVGSAPSSSARVKHLVGADSTKVGGMRSIRGVLPEPPADTLENHDMFRETARARP